MAKKPVTIGGVTYESKKVVKERIQRILYGYHLNERLDVIDDTFIRDLLVLHNEYQQKVGVGISHFTIRPDFKYGTRCVHIHRVDGSMTDVSLERCLTNRTRRQDVLAALRVAVEAQVRGYKEDALLAQPCCPYTEVPLTFENSHVDHEHPLTFQVIVDRWFAERGLAFDDVAISTGRDMQIAVEFTDTAQEDDWRQYHAANAQLRLISTKANLSDTRVGRRANELPFAT